ncbi:GHKL domain-containing protein [Metaclostridioides mangenotii]|nr:GHKL domain-containing protein [Clostridioides mangenotii]
MTLTAGVIEWYVLKYIFDEASEAKRSKLVSNLLFLVPICVLFLMTVIRVNPILKLSIGIAMAFTIYKYNYKVTILKCVFITLFYFMLLAGVDTIAGSLVILINKVPSMDVLLRDNVFRLENTIMAKSLLLLLIPIIKGIKLRIEISKREYIYITIPIIANIISIVTIISLLFSISTISYSQSIIAFSASCVLLLSNASLILIVSNIVKHNDSRVENEIIKEKTELQYKHYLCLQKKQINTFYDTHNIFLDVLLNEKKSICDESIIDFNVDVDFSKCDFMETADVCCIYSNMIDNSIEACKNIRNNSMIKRIDISGKVVNKFHVIKCKNPKTNKLILKNKILTNEQEPLASLPFGMGINSIIKSVEKYKGEVVLDLTEDDFEMTILIPLVRNRFKVIGSLN